MKQVRRIRKTAQENRLIRARLEAVPENVTTTTAKVARIQELIPLGLLWVEDALQQEVAQLAGARYQREDGQSGVVRYGTQPGSIYYWKTSNQRQRWLATALLDIEPRLRRIKGCKHLPLLRQAMRAQMKTETKKAA